MYKKLINDEWVVVTPQEGDVVRLYDSTGAFIAEHIYTPPVEVTRNKIVITSHDNRLIGNINEPIQITVEIQNSLGELVDITDTFAAPISRLGGSIEKTIAINFVDGIAVREVTFNKSGEFCITEDLLNMHLPQEQQFTFETLNISIME